MALLAAMSSFNGAQTVALWRYAKRHAKAGVPLTGDQLRQALWAACQEYSDWLEQQDGLLPPAQEAYRVELADMLYPV